MKKAQFGFLPAVTIMIMIILTIYFTYSVFSQDISRAKQKTMNYYAENANENVQLIKQTFEKTALFWGVMKTADELGEGGGVSEQNINAAAVNPALFCPYMNTSATGGSDILYWALAGNNRIVKRVPFIYHEDENIVADDVTFILLNNPQHEEYIEAVKNDIYDLHLTAQALFLKEGTLDMEVIIKNNIGTILITHTFIPALIEDGRFSLTLTPLLMPASSDSVELHFIGKNLDGSSGKIAKIKQVAVSIYDSGVVLEPNRIVTGHLVTPKVNLNTELGINADEDIKITTGAFDGSFSRKTSNYDSPVSALMWASDDVGIVATMEDPFDSSVDAVRIRSRGLVDEDVYVRYWYLYDAGIYFVNNLDRLIKSRIWRELNDLEDYYSAVGATVCGKPGCQIDDATASYSKGDIYDEIDDAISDLETDLDNIYNANGIYWDISVPSSMLDSTDLSPIPTGVTNQDHSCSSSTETNENENIVHTDHYYSSCVQTTECDPDSCSKSCNRCGSSCSYSASWDSKWRNRCTYRYGHTYLVNNIHVLVKITDKKYYITDSNGNNQNLVLKFFVEIDKVIDNYCNGYNCKTFTSIGGANPYGSPLTPPNAIPDVNTPLAITDIAVSGISDTSATISWKSTKAATATLVINGVTYSLALGTSFSQNVVGLSEDTFYTYTITIPGASNSPYTGSLTTAESAVAPPIPPCTIAITNPGAFTIHTGNINIDAQVTCPAAAGDIVAGEDVTFKLDADYTVPRNVPVDGPTATFSLTWDSSVIPFDGNYIISAEFTKNTDTITDGRTVVLNNGHVMISVTSIDIALTDTTADIAAVANKNGLTMSLFKHDGTPTGIIPVEVPPGTYTFSFAGLTFDTHYPTTVLTDYYILNATDGIDILSLNDSISFWTGPKITTSTTNETAEIIMDATRSTLNMTLKDHNGVKAGNFSQIGTVYNFSFSGLANNTRYPDTMHFYTLTVSDAATANNYTNIWFKTKS